MFVHTIDPVAFSIGPLQVYWYGIIWALSFLITYFFFKTLAKNKKLEITIDDIDSFFLWLILGIVLGARLIYVLVYNPIFYFNNPLQVFAVYNGGLSFHGGMLGAVFVGWKFSKKHKLKFYQLADLLVIPLALVLGLGRIGNFINGELYGIITSVPWAFKFSGVDGFRHPSQLYESAKNFLIFGVLYSLKDKKFKDGTLFWLFIMMYGLLRFSIEFFRVPDYLFLGFSPGQWLSAAMFIAAITYFIKNNKK
ncbi:prolipoprotein diacylglyceryl transferase [Candidatus Woesearchaeota archaeon]|nr:prolipoprotein diacylglyceryl transferase [Candidatus Woesearchaeota archaeon]